MKASEVKETYAERNDIRCKYCNRRLGSGDWIGDFYGVCDWCDAE